MSRHLVTAREGDTLFQVGQLMQWRGVRHVPVLNEQDLVVGIVSERDLIDLGERVRDDKALPIRAVMHAPVATVAVDEDVAVAASIMASRKIGCVPVVAAGKLVGLVTTTDLVGLAVSATVREQETTGAPVSAIMRRVVVTVAPEDELMEAVGLMVDREVRHLPVVDAQERLVGMLSESDVRALVGDPILAIERWVADDRFARWRVADAMTPRPITAALGESVSAVARKLARQRVGALPVVDERQRCRGIVSYVDVLRALSA